DYAMRFERGVRLHLGNVVTGDCDVRLFEALVDVALLLDGWSVDIARLRNILRASASARAALLIGRPRKDNRCIGHPSLSHADDEGQRFVLNLYQCRCLFCGVRSNGGHRGDRLSSVAYDWILYLLQCWIAQNRVAHHMMDNVDALNTWIPFRR